jgi:hypothetical protein
MTKSARKPAWMALFAAGLLTASGCADPTTVLVIETHQNPARPVLLHERFDEAWFASDARGNWDIVLRAARPSPVEAGGELIEIFHARIFWRPRPGTSYAERTQTNAQFCYALIDVDRAISFEGTGFIYPVLDRTGVEMRGKVESGTLTPTRRAGDARDPLGACRITGRFTARQHRARVVEALTLIRHRLGPAERRTQGNFTSAGAGIE